MTLLLLVACAYRLGIPDVSHGAGDARLPLVHTSTDRRRIYVPVDAGARGEWVFFLDTGYSYSTCDDDFVAALGLETRGSSPVRGEVGTLQTSKARLPTLHFGPHSVDGLVCQTRDLGSTSSIDDPDEVPVAGVLGMDVLRGFDMTLADGWMTLSPPAEQRFADGPGVLRLRREMAVGTRVTLKVDLDGQTDRLLLDTGATDTYIDGRRLGLLPSYVDRGATLRGTGTGGSSTRDLTHYEIDRFALGEAFMGPVTLTDRRKNVFLPGLLGLDVLDAFQQEYQWRHRRARFTAREPQALPSWEDRPEGAIRVGPIKGR